MTEPLVPERQICAVKFCSRIARRWLFGEKYCEGCASSVAQAQYMATLTPEAKERALYRRSLITVDPPEGVKLPEPLAAPERSGWSSRR